MTPTLVSDKVKSPLKFNLQKKSTYNVFKKTFFPSPIFITCTHVVRVTLYFNHSSHLSFYSALCLPHLNRLSVSLKAASSQALASSKSVVMKTLYHPTHTNGWGGKRDRREPISISVPDLNPRESRVISGFSLCRRSCSFHATCFSSIQENSTSSKKNSKTVISYFFPKEKDFTCQSMPSACTEKVGC